jgi:hypothetical protein
MEGLRGSDADGAEVSARARAPTVETVNEGTNWLHGRNLLALESVLVSRDASRQWISSAVAAAARPRAEVVWRPRRSRPGPCSVNSCTSSGSVSMSISHQASRYRRTPTQHVTGHRRTGGIPLARTAPLGRHERAERRSRARHCSPAARAWPVPVVGPWPPCRLPSAESLAHRHLARLIVARQPRPACASTRSSIESSGGLRVCDEIGDGGLAVLRIGHSDNGDLRHPGTSAMTALSRWGTREAGDEDELASRSTRMRSPPASRSRCRPVPHSHRPSGRRLIGPVAGEQVGAAHQIWPGRRSMLRCVTHLELDAGQRSTDAGGVRGCARRPGHRR